VPQPSSVRFATRNSRFLARAAVGERVNARVSSNLRAFELTRLNLKINIHLQGRRFHSPLRSGATFPRSSQRLDGRDRPTVEITATSAKPASADLTLVLPAARRSTATGRLQRATERCAPSALCSAPLDPVRAERSAARPPRRPGERAREKSRWRVNDALNPRSTLEAMLPSLLPGRGRLKPAPPVLPRRGSSETTSCGRARTARDRHRPCDGR
jgi:hypothetical protein